MKYSDVKKIDLAILPTPLQRMNNLEKALNCNNLYIKRDDLTDVGMSGNKIRKLEYFVQDAIDKGCNTLLTFGGPQTNHGRLTAAAAVRQNMKSILVLKGEDPGYYSGNLILDKMMGADIYFTSGDPQKLAKEITEKYESNGDKVYSIPIGGSNEIGALGYINMVKELMDQLEEMKINPKYLIVGSGSLGTFCGIWLGIKFFNATFEIIPIAVDPESAFGQEEAMELINKISEKYELGITANYSELKFNFGRGDISYSGIGYNIPDEGTQKAMNLLAKTEAIFTDPCYSGKAFHGFVDMVQNVLPNSDGAIFLHTGGIPGIWTKDHLDAAQAYFKK